MKKIILIIIAAIFSSSSFGQHQHHPPPPKEPVKKEQKKPVTKKPVLKKKTIQTKLPKDTVAPRPKDTIPTTHDHMKMETVPKIDTQHTGHDHHVKMDTIPKVDSFHTGHGTMNMIDMADHMTHAFSLSLPMSRNSSGTAWQPDATPMYGYMKMTKKGSWMFHGSIFLRYNHQDIFSKGIRSDSLTDRVDAPNWVMVMASRKIKTKGLLSFSAMLSADELVMGQNGYPLLFQSGETADGKALVDRQHPHDFISGLSVGYTHMVNKDMDLTAYLGYPGEPAIGPPAFMHRISSMNNPDAPLGHHWQDATHITFGVATLGLRYKTFKFEFSNFTGREPNENRYNFDKPKFDSWSYRFSVNPTDNFSIQFSQAFIKSPEALEPEENLTRTTASILHSIILGEKTHLTSAAIWGMNQIWDHRPEHSLLLESNMQKNKTAIYGRYEFIQKSSHELQIPQQHDELFPINAITIGGSYNFLHAFNTNFRIGVQGSAFFTPSSLRSLYGKLPLSAEIYIHVLPINMNALKGRHSNH